MLKKMIIVLMAFFLSNLAYAETFAVDIGHDGHVEKVITSEQAHTGTLEIYDGEKLLGKFNNLIVDQLALSSDVITLVGGGLAIEIDSDGGKDKFHMIVPIYKDGDRLYVNCVYKSVYDSVNEERSVGTSCKADELNKFNVSSAINDSGLNKYKAGRAWLKAIHAGACPNAVGIEYGKYRIARCSVDGVSDTQAQKIIALDSSGKVIFYLVGYEFIPGLDGNEFFLVRDLKDQSVIFDAGLGCFLSGAGSDNGISGKAKIASKFGINFSLNNVNDCLVGKYSYSGKNKDISLRGMKKDGLIDLMELDKNNVSTGLFLLDRLDSAAHGAWIGVPPKDVLTVN
jgi:hypothetical protein